MLIQAIYSNTIINVNLLSDDKFHKLGCKLYSTIQNGGFRHE